MGSANNPQSNSPEIGQTAAAPSPARKERSAEPETQRVVMLVNSLRHYHARFYELLREYLSDAGVMFDLVYSVPRGVEGGRGDTVDLPWAHRVKQRRFGLGRYELTWQDAFDEVSGADLVVVQQATKRLENYVLLAKQAMGGPRVAFWGHGRNFQATSRLQALAEGVKARLLGQAHWFFAYNEVSAEVLEASGYPLDRVTVVGNTIDTRSLAEAREGVNEADREALRSDLGVDTTRVGIYCGAMYPEKRLDFLVEAALEIRAIVPDFELVCIGSGVDRHIVDRAAEQHDWIHSVGPQFADDLARHFSLGRVFLMPGLVGLAILDSFVLGVPLVTTSDALHSPEIAYLEDGENGILVEGDGSGGAFAAAVARVLIDDALHERLVAGCRSSASAYSVENMAEVYANGLIEALDKPHRSRGRSRTRME